jgi:outer membrane biosynthesis protein TonB
MRLPARSATWLLPLLLAGCHHKAQVAHNLPLAPAIEEPPPQLHLPPPNDIPPPDVTAPVQQPAPVITPPKEPEKKPARHKKPANTNSQQASIASPAVSAIGQLTTGDPSDLRQQTDASIESTEKSLNSIHRGLSDQEAKTAAQIREFLKEARAALLAGDVDGAHTLAIKAKVLLDELHP